MPLTTRFPAARRLTILAFAGLLGVTACGSSSGDAAGSASESSATTAASGSTETTASGKSDGGGSAAEGLVAAFKAVEKGDCAKAKTIGDGFDSADIGEGLDSMKQLSSGMDELADNGPSELRPDFAIMAKAFGTMVQIYEELDLSDPAAITKAMEDPEKAAKVAAMGEAMEAAEVDAASERISAWLEKRCPGMG